MAPYPWSEHKYWSESRASEQHRKLSFARHDLLGRLEDAYNETEPVWRNTLSSDDVPWLKDHRMQGFATFPLAGYLSMAVEAACQRSQLRSRPVSLERFYAELEANGAGYRSSFRLQPEAGLTSHGSFTASRIAVPDTAPQMPSLYETPSILSVPFIDFLFQHVFPILGAGYGQMPCLFMPSAIKEIDMSAALPNQPGQQVQAVAYGCPDPASRGPVEFWIDGWHSSQADPVIRITGFKMTPVGNLDLDGQSPRPLCYKIKWEPLKAGKVQSNGQAVTNGYAHTDGHTIGVMNGSGTNGRHGRGEQGAATVVISDAKESDQLAGALLDLIETRTGSRASVCPLFNIEPSSSARYICLAEVDAPLIHNMTAHTFARLQTLLLQCGSMLWVTSGAYRCSESPGTCKTMAQGLLRTVRSETGKAAAMLDLDPGSRLGAPDRAELIVEALDASLASQDGTGGEFEFAEEAGRLVVPRVAGDTDIDVSIFRESLPAAPYLQDFEQAGRRLKVVVGSPGALSSLYWTDQAEFCLNDEEIEIKVAATGRNFKDVVIGMGELASPHLGIECSGTVTRTGRNVESLAVGDRVCAIVRGAYGTHAVCHSTSAAAITADISFEVAASLPVIYSTAYYAITELARIEPGEKILIHAASRGVGQAAIQLSRNTDSGLAVREATGGKGVDVVLNSLAGDLLRETWDCVAPFRRFIEIGKRDIVANTRLEMANFNNNYTFSSIDLTLMAAERPKTMSRVLTAIMNLISKRIIYPIGPITTVGISEVESALRTLQSGKTSGKVVVNHLALNQQVKATHPMTAPYLPSDATYVIIGGTGGIGRSLAKRMDVLFEKRAFGDYQDVVRSKDKAKQAEVMKSMLGSSMGELELLALVEASIRGQVGGEQCITGLDFSNPTALPYYSSDNRFLYLRKAALAKLVQDNDAAESVDMPISHRLRIASSFEQAHEIVTRGIKEKLSAILMIPAEVMAA
ncbi:polyketide synthase dehydratase [Hirsutella rhossiliensis]|uniref:Polyketide synthase dehydratase domain-containing protein n=1 Tax=Hirsutella rhossiliensis TaxID=111463 RepID=A0A9P8N1Q3_9HYPO|nr:polyketide synthase dehydratase domain-containing protein [Hirsutella rhossiliensis]KAH0965265.1 polyketide synthase dehydratase domain-containing protein [Hirsutella rhossiliensis]